MHLAKVIGMVISTQKTQGLVGGKLLVIRTIDEYSKPVENAPPYVALDRVGAGMGDCVLVDWRGSRDSELSMAGDMSIVGIIDEIQTEE